MASSSISADVVSSADIKTLAQLYASSSLSVSNPVSSAHNRAPFAGDHDLNDRVDMIVNAANRSLLGGGGVDGAIHRAAGWSLKKACKDLGGAQTGETKITLGFNLPAKRIAHTVGPMYSKLHAERAEGHLRACYRSSLEACRDHGGGSIGFSSISTGIYDYPMVDATHVAAETTRRFLASDTTVG
ncbi:MAG: hypothetical protein TREMPRED_005187 [Tremellales sp. Tagirdzhanova-0007]|nr:MAG: hypothetical protein TREMPRED_005187 [Tremellales sp. Tagirdzhanova-0007]